MKRNFKIALSQNAIPASAMASVFAQHEGKNPVAIIEDFEARLSTLTGAHKAIALNSGSAGIHLGLKLLGVGEGDIVIAPTFTYVASVSPLFYLRATPVLVDADPLDWNLDLKQLGIAIETCIAKGKKPKAIIVVHIYGMPSRMKEIMSIGKQFDIAVLEDAAEAIGSSYENSPMGVFGNAGVLSFNNNKILTTFGGGAVLVRSEADAARILYWATHARSDRPYYQHEEEGYNCRMSPVAAACGLAEFRHLKHNVDRRRKTYQTYQEMLDSLTGISWQGESKGARSNRWLSCLVAENGIEKIRQSLADQAIETRPLWKPMHQQPLFKGCQGFLTGTADRLFERGICLPSGNHITDSEIGEIIASIKHSK